MNGDAHEFRFGRFRLDTKNRVLLVDGRPARVGARALDVLAALIRRRDRTVGKDELFDLVWPGVVVEENNLQVHVSALRKLLGPQSIVTVPGRGYQFVLPLDGEAVASSHAAGATVELAPRELPQPPPLFGRDADLSAAHERLRLHPVVSIVGPGGIGKTRLARQMAYDLQTGFKDGVWLIDLTPLSAGEAVAPLVAQALSIELAATQPAHDDAASATVAAALRDQTLLLVLDNCEHVLAKAAALVDAVRQRAPGVRVLCTAQEPLKLVDEQVLRLGPLALPRVGEPPTTPEDAGAYGAVQLFVARAHAADRRFVLTPQVLGAVVEICRRLDGVPLAIELAAARLPLLGIDGLRERLDERLRLLTAGARGAPQRQKTLRAALEWSHGLLGADEQTVFRRLAVFVGGFSLELAQQVVADEVLDPWSVIDQVGLLVDKSLVVATGSGRPRYRLLESARSYALERLAASGEELAVRRRHAQALRDLLIAFDAAVVTTARFDALVHGLRPERDNLRAAVQWAIEAPEARPTAVAIVAASDWLWIEIDPHGEGLQLCRLVRRWVDATLPLALAARFRLASQALSWAARQSPAEWIEDARQALSNYRELGERVGLYRALCVLGGASRELISEEEAGALLEEAARLEDPHWSARLRTRRQVALEWWHDLGGRFEQAREAGRQHVALARASGSIGAIGALSNLADTELALGEVDAAIELCQAAIARANQLGHPAAATDAYANMVPALLERGDLPGAEEAIRAGRALLIRGLGTAFWLLVPLALLVQRRGDIALALQLIAAADRAYGSSAHVMHPPEQRMRERVLACAGQAMAAAQIEQYRRAAADWSEDEAFARAGV